MRRLGSRAGARGARASRWPCPRTRSARRRRCQRDGSAAAAARRPLAGSTRAISGAASSSTATWMQRLRTEPLDVADAPASCGVRPRCSPPSSASASGRIATEPAPGVRVHLDRPGAAEHSTAPSLRTWPGNTLISGLPTNRATRSVAGSIVDAPAAARPAAAVRPSSPRRGPTWSSPRPGRG